MTGIKAAAAIAAFTLGGILEELGRQRAGWLLLAGAFSLGVTVTAGAMWANMRYQEQLDYGPRIERLEDWRAYHQEEVSEPALDRLDRLEVRLEDWLNNEAEIMQQMVYEMYCEFFPTRCRPRPEGGDGGGESEMMMLERQRGR